jgi:hypothetical protein
MDNNPIFDDPILFAYDRAVLALQSAIPGLEEERAYEVVTAISLAVIENIKEHLQEQPK